MPGERFPLVRAEKALLRAVDLDGTPFEIECDGWFSRIFQHEYDHLLGYLYTVCPFAKVPPRARAPLQQELQQELECLLHPLRGCNRSWRVGCTARPPLSQRTLARLLFLLRLLH